MPESSLIDTTFKDLFDRSVLPSGYEFELMPDTVEVALRVAEVHDAKTWKRKALQAFTVLKKVGGIDVQEAGPTFIHGMLDADVTFVSLAWSAQMSGLTLKLLDGGVPCPTCGVPFLEVDFGTLGIMVRGNPLGAPGGSFQIQDIVDDELPKSLKGCSMYIVDPTWQNAKSRMSEQAWESYEASSLYRYMASLRASAHGGSQRALSIDGEVKALRTRTIPKILRIMDANIPHFKPHLDMKCTHCGEVAKIPFDQAL